MIEELLLYILFGILIVCGVVFLIAGILYVFESCCEYPPLGLMIIGVILGIFLYLDKYYWNLLF